MAIAFVQSNSKNAGAVASTTMLLGTVTAGNFIHVSVAQTAVGTTCTVTDNLGNVYTEIDHMDGTSVSLWHFYAKNIVAGACTLTITLASAVALRLGAAEYSGVDPSSPIDVFGQNTGTSANPSVSVTTTFPNPLLIHSTRWSNVGTLTFNGGYTFRESQPAGASAFYGFGDLISGDLAGSETATATLAGSFTWNSLLVAIKPLQSQTPVALVPSTKYRIHEYVYTC